MKNSGESKDSYEKANKSAIMLSSTLRWFLVLEVEEMSFGFYLSIFVNVW